MKHLFLTITIVLLFATANFAQRNRLITGNSAGKIRIGMTVAKARKAMKGFRLIRGSDGEGIYLVDVMTGRKSLMTLYAGDSDQQEKINERAKIEQIQVWDSRFRTYSGIHPDLLIKDAEKKLGRIQQVELTQIEQREYATFLKQPKGIEFRVGGTGDYVGVYSFPSTTSTLYRTGSTILGIIIDGTKR